MNGNGVKLVFKYLDVDYIDLYYQHRVDTSMPIEDTMSVKTFTFNFKLIKTIFIYYLFLNINVSHYI